MKIWLLLATLLVASSVSLAQYSSQEDYDAEPLGDIEKELEGLIECTFDHEDEEEELIFYDEEDYDDDYDDDDSYEDDDESSEEDGGRRSKMKKTWRKGMRQVMRYMQRHDVSDVDEVPGRLFGTHLRKTHNGARRGDGEETGGPRARVYRKIVRVLERKIANGKTADEAGNQYNGLCSRLETKTPRSRVLDSLPESIKDDYLAMFNNRKQQLTECCQLGDEEREMCFEDAYEMKMDNLCAIQWQMEEYPDVQDNTMFLRMMSRRQRCCQILEPSERRECFKEEGRQAKQSRRQRRDVSEDEGSEEEWDSLTPQRKVDRVCRRLDERGDEILNARRQKLESRPAHRQQRGENMEEHFEAMMQCCAMEGSDRYECVDDLKRSKMLELCSSEPEAESRRRNGPAKTAIRERCCALEGDERDECIDDVVREHLSMKRERHQAKKEERKQARQEGDRAENRREGRQQRQGRRQEKREGRQERRRLRVEMEEEMGVDSDRTRRSIAQVEREEVQDRRWKHKRGGRGQGKRGGRPRGQEPAERQERRQQFAECCELGSAFGESSERVGPRDGKAMSEMNAMCYASAREAAPHTDDSKCVAVYKKCCVRAIYGIDDDEGWRHRRGRRRRVRVEVEEEDAEEGEEAVAELIGVAEAMLAQAEY